MGTRVTHRRGVAAENLTAREALPKVDPWSAEPDAFVADPSSGRTHPTYEDQVGIRHHPAGERGHRSTSPAGELCAELAAAPSWGR